MASVSVTNTFVANTTASASEVNQNFSDLVNYINNRNSGSATWDAVSISTATTVPLIVNNSTGTSNIANFQDNGTNVFAISDGGAITQDGGAVFNEAGADKDFRIEGDTQQNLFFVDASVDEVGIGTGTPSARLHVLPEAGGSMVACLINNNTSTGNILTLQDNGVVTHAFQDGGLVIFNEAGTSTADVRMEGDTEQNLFFLDASADEIGIGTSTPAARVHIISTAGGSEVGLRINGNTSTGNVLNVQDNGVDAFAVADNKNVVCNSAAILTTATDGFLYIASCAGAPSGVPTSFAGRTPMVYDTTNNRFYIYNGAWRSVLLA